MFGGYPPTAIGYPPTAIGYTPTAIGYPPTAINYPPTAIGYTPTAIGYPPTAIGYPPTAIGYPPTAIGYPPTAINYPPTAIGYPPTAIGYPPTAIGYPPTAIGYPPTAIGYTPTAIGYPPAAIIGRIGHSEFFFFIMATPAPNPELVWFSGGVLQKEDLEVVAELSRTFGFFVLSDEVYCKLLHDDVCALNPCPLPTYRLPQHSPRSTQVGHSKDMALDTGCTAQCSSTSFCGTPHPPSLSHSTGHRVYYRVPHQPSWNTLPSPFSTALDTLCTARYPISVYGTTSSPPFARKKEVMDRGLGIALGLCGPECVCGGGGGGGRNPRTTRSRTLRCSG